MLTDILLAFIPLFVAFDTVGVLPLFLGLTEGLEKQQRQLLRCTPNVTTDNVLSGGQWLASEL